MTGSVAARRSAIYPTVAMREISNRAGSRGPNRSPYGRYLNPQFDGCPRPSHRGGPECDDFTRSVSQPQRVVGHCARQPKVPEIAETAAVGGTEVVAQQRRQDGQRGRTEQQSEGRGYR